MADSIQEEIRRPEQTGQSPELTDRPSIIHIYDVKELRYWTKTLGVSSDALVSAVRAVGHDPGRVTEYLQRQRAS